MFITYCRSYQKSSDYIKLEQYYEQIRHFREGINKTISRNKVFKEIKENYPDDWLLPVELYELARSNGDFDFADQIQEHLEDVKYRNPKFGHLIDDGLALVDQSLVDN